jgi:RNA polymerase sigma-70 factor, ECF subfamily
VTRTFTTDACGVGVPAEAEATGEPRIPYPRRASRAFAREALEHIDSLHHFARYLSGSAVEAEDLVQEAYARALRAAPTFAEGTNLRAWLFRILRNAFIDSRRRARRTAEDGACESASDEAPFAHEPLFGDVEMEALRGAVASDIERALAELTADARAVVLLDLEGFSEGEIAGIVGCAVGTVKSRLSRARDSLRKLLGQYRR